MKTISSYFLVSLALLGAVSCTNSAFKKTKSGLLYKIYSDGKGETAKKGQFLKANVVQKIRDSILYSSEGNMPIYLPVDSPRPVYSPVEVFSLLRKGDSCVVVESADTLARRMGQLPPWIRKKDKLTYAFKIVDVFASEDLLTADRNQEMAKQKDREIKQVESYLAKNNIQAQKTEKGTYYVIQNEGSGTPVDSGKQISVRYTGKLIPSGKQFETNMTDTVNGPFKFVVGTGSIIPGWDDGLRKFKKGGKGTLYIPAYLAYDQQFGPGKTPFENLIFDVEIVDVTDAPPPAANPQMPAMPMPQGQPQPNRAQPQPHK